MSIAPSCAARVYKNKGNPPLLEMIRTRKPGMALDCGCGAGDNARLLNELGWRVSGITLSSEERIQALPYCEHVYLADLELGILRAAWGPFNLIVFSHVIEHLRNPERALSDALVRLAPGGVVAVALPNVLYWPERIRFLCGRFEYTDAGIMDETHVRFYTFESGKRTLETNGFQVISSKAEGHFPCRPLRRLFPRLATLIDRCAVSLFPGVFGNQSLYLLTPR